MSHLVSVVIPVYNAKDFINETINSVLNQTYTDFEIIIVNDGSTDGTTNELEKIEDTRIRIVHQKNTGHSCARNRGIKESKGKYIAFLDADDLWEMEKLNSQVKFLESNTEYVCVYTKGSLIDQRKKFIRNISFEGYSGKILDKLLLNALALHCSSLLLYKSIFEEIGVFDDKLKAYEDWDLFLRISQKHLIGYINKSLFMRRFGHGGNSDRTSVAESYLTDAFKIVEKYNDENVSKNKIISYIYKMEGFRKYYYNETKVTRYYFWKSIKANPYNIQTYIAFLYTFINKNIITHIHEGIYIPLKERYFNIFNR